MCGVSLERKGGDAIGGGVGLAEMLTEHLRLHRFLIYFLVMLPSFSFWFI